jgi:hypothetical protein
VSDPIAIVEVPERPQPTLYLIMWSDTYNDGAETVIDEDGTVTEPQINALACGLRANMSSEGDDCAWLEDVQLFTSWECLQVDEGTGRRWVNQYVECATVNDIMRASIIERVKAALLSSGG